MTEIKPSCWLFVPGANAALFDLFCSKGIMALGNDGLSKPLTAFSSLTALSSALSEDRKDGYTRKLSAEAYFTFLKKVKPGDLVIAKGGRKKVLGVGKVLSDYYYDPSLTAYRHLRKVDWFYKGELSLSVPLPPSEFSEISSHQALIETILNSYKER